MEIPAIGPASAQASAAENAEKGLTESFDTFLTLLTTQLRYQDPLEPMDSAEFTNQLVQFTEVEQSISTNKQLEQLIGMQNANQAVSAIGYIGNTVEATGTSMPLVDGAAEMTYTLPENAETASVLIFNAAGQLVQSIDAPTIAGKHTVAWNGEASDGSTMPDGTYTIAVSARNANSDVLEVPTGIVGKVTGTQNDETGAHLSIGSVLVGLDKIVSVSKPVSGSS
jgi:flagellar basal-body rod modification protein FlgD